MAVQHSPAGIKRPVFGTRLMVRCPVTGLPTDTGFDLSAPLESVDRGEQLLVDCLECGQDHAWRMEDSFAEPFADVADDLLAAVPARGSAQPALTRRLA